MTDYSIEFQTLAAESGGNSSSLTDAFYNGLSNDIKDKLAARDPPKDLDTLIPHLPEGSLPMVPCCRKGVQ